MFAGREAAAELPEHLATVRGSVAWVCAILWIEPRDTWPNLDNARFRNPRAWLQTELGRN